MKRITFIFCIVFLNTLSLLYAQPESKTVRSPDKSIVAKIISTGKREDAGSESRIEIRTVKGKLLCSKSYLSDDHSHGDQIWKAEWTPDSKFFVFNSVSSGGHQPGHVLTRFWMRNENKIDVLDPYVGIWVMGDFKLKTPDSVTVVVSDRLPSGKIVDTLTRSVSLGKLNKRK